MITKLMGESGELGGWSEQLFNDTGDVSFDATVTPKVSRKRRSYQ